jgi:hypothetical protein
MLPLPPEHIQAPTQGLGRQKIKRSENGIVRKQGKHMRYAPRYAAAAALAFLGLLQLSTAFADSWLPVPPEDLQMTSEPRAPGASAILLYHQADRNDSSCFEQFYNRIKILTEEGRKQANVELTFNAGEAIRGIEARTIHRDGTIVPFGGTVYDSVVVQGLGEKRLAKTFTLPDVDVGSIIEYRFERRYSCNILYETRWFLNTSLFIRDARFSLTPNRFYTLRWDWPRDLPEGSSPPQLDHGVVRMEAHNLPAFVTEPYMPPVNQLQQRVDFIYSTKPITTAEQFWKDFGLQQYRYFSTFVDARRAMREALAQIVQPQDPPETKLRKIYTRVQQLRNTAYQTQSEREADAEAPNMLRDVADVWKRGYGTGHQLCYLFVALAREAGLQADPVYLSTRNRYFFDRSRMHQVELNVVVVQAHLGGQEIFLQPSMPYLPFGKLPWNDTDVWGLRLDAKGGTWVNTALPPPEAFRVERKAALKIDRSGELTGKVTLTYAEQAAAARRMNTRNDTDKDRTQYLINEIGRPGPQGMRIKVVNAPDWTGTDTPLTVEYEVHIPDWVQLTGHRQVFPAGLFGRLEQHMFEHDTRVHPIYFEIPLVVKDDLTIEVPAGWSVSSLPKPRNMDLKGLRYQSTAEHTGDSVHLTREIWSNLELVDVKSYKAIQGFYQNVRTGDEEPVVLSSDAPAP